MAKATLGHRIERTSRLVDIQDKHGELAGIGGRVRMPDLPDKEVIEEWLENRLPGSVSKEREARLRSAVADLKGRGIIRD